MEESVVPVFYTSLTEEDLEVRRQAALDMAEVEKQELLRENLRQSGLEKLKKLGLTEDEAKAIAGV